MFGSNSQAARDGFAYEGYLNNYLYGYQPAAPNENFLIEGTAPSSFNPEFTMPKCSTCSQQILDTEASLKFSCSHMAHIRCLNKENLSQLQPENACEHCLPKKSKDETLTIGDMEKYAKQLKKREEFLEDRFKRFFTFDKKYDHLSALSRLALIPSEHNNGINIFNVMRQPWDREFLLKKNITFSQFMKNNVHIQTIYQVFNLKTLQDLLDVGFTMAFISHPSSDGLTNLVPIYDFCMIYKMDYDLLSRQREESGGPLSTMDIARLRPTAKDLRALEIGAKELVDELKVSKQFFFLANQIPLSAWVHVFGLTRNHLRTLGLQATDYEILGWTRKMRQIHLPKPIKKEQLQNT